jgi:hypothetical protein
MGMPDRKQIIAAQERKAAGGPYTRKVLPAVTPCDMEGFEPEYVGGRRRRDPITVTVFPDPSTVPLVSTLLNLPRVDSRFRAGAYVVEPDTDC